MITFNADEIFEMAEQIERNGAKFYRKAAGQTADDAASKTLLGLAEMEDEHEETFAAMRAELAGKEKARTVFDPDNEAALYLRAMADGKVFDPGADAAEALTGAESLEDIIRTAIGLEKDSIVFYLGIRDMVPQAGGRDRIDEIIAQEMGHITTLSEQLAAS